MRPLRATVTTMGLITVLGLSICLYVVLTQEGCEAKPCDSCPLVRIPGLGDVLGSVDTTLWSHETFFSFRSIPFAESPKGNLRFQLPVPKSPWKQPHDGSEFGNRCPVITTVAELTPEQQKQDLEDCLSVSVYTKTTTDKRPVMFYIYGGGFYNGSASDHPPHKLMEKDIVLVVVQFRVGALGWLSNLESDIPGNLGIADVRLALQWTKKYISAFGGNPDDITVFSQSAGAAISSLLLLHPDTPANAFQKLIVQSGSIFADWAINREPLAQVERICKALECSECKTGKSVKKCLTNVDVPKLLEVTAKESFAPVVGDVNGLFPMEPHLLAKSYKKNVTLMTGFTKHDGTFVLATYYDTLKALYGDLSYVNVRSFASGLMERGMDGSGLSYNLLMRLFFSPDLLNSNDHKRAIPAYFDLCNTMFMKSPILTLARKVLEAAKAPVYVYTFDYEGNNTRFGYEFGNEHYPFEGGVHHSDDNIYVFNTHKLNERDTEMSKEIIQLWTSFAISGRPKSRNEDVTIPAMLIPDGPYFHIDSDIHISDNILDELTVTIDDPDNKKFDREDVPF